MKKMSDSVGKEPLRLLAVLIALLTTSVWAGAVPEPIQQTFLGQVSYNKYVQEPWKPIRIGAVTIKIANDVDNQIVVSGSDKKGQTWNVYVKTGAGTGYSLAWTADLDGDGTKDLIFTHFDPGNGRCLYYRSRLTTILFDGDGRPSPWELEGHFNVDHSQTETGKGILDLGDWNRNGRAELVQLACYGYEYQQLPYEPYRLVGVYEARKGVWRRLSAPERALHEAVYRQIASAEFRKLFPEAEERKLVKEKGAFVPDYSNDPARGTTGRIVEFMPTQGDERAKTHCGVLRDFDELNGRLIEKTKEEKERTRERCDEHLTLENGTVCFTSYRDSKPGIVLTRADSTEAVMDWESERAKSLLKQIIAEKLPVTLTGQLEEGVCSPTLIRASKP